jgi:5-oxopent-3-ene-1,2,5-tricarboxylate decarboxylase / 2-hydroxyhepta-2,4-diene-1,7-dioate isomerase
MTPLPSILEFDFAPYRLSGVVFGTLLNHEPALQALGDTVNAPPYKAPPIAPVLYLKPRNTLSSDGALVNVPVDTSELEVGAALGIVIGRTACQVSSEQALQFVAGYTVVNDISVPHDLFYRPSLRFKARDGFCPIGPVVVPCTALANPNDLSVQIYVDDELKQQTTTGQRIRNVAHLIADVTEFMTLQPGDVLMLGVSAGAVRVRAGQQCRIVISEVGELVNHFSSEGSIA